MKSKLVSLALLIPVAVLAQTAPPQNQPIAPQPNMMQNPPVKLTNPADALSNAKKQAKELKGKLPSNADNYGSSNSGCSTTGEECYYTGGNG